MPDLAAHRPAPQVIGVIHLPPLPGTPFHDAREYSEGLTAARASVQALVAGGAQAALIQTADRVYDLTAQADPMRVALLTRLLTGLRETVPDHFQLGVQVMRNCVEESLAIARATECGFVRATALIGSTLSASGWVTPNAAAIMRYRDAIDAWGVRLYADIASAHNTWANDNLPQLAGRAITAGADGVVVGLPDLDVTIDMLRQLRSAKPDIKVILAGHATFENAGQLLPLVDAAFVSGALSPQGWHGAMDLSLISQFVQLARDSAR